jgi:protein-arginine kinase
MKESEVIISAVLSCDPAFYHDRSALVLEQKKNLVRSFEFNDHPEIACSRFEVTHIESLKGDYIQQADQVVQRWMTFNRW